MAEPPVPTVQTLLPGHDSAMPQGALLPPSQAQPHALKASGENSKVLQVLPTYATAPEAHQERLP